MSAADVDPAVSDLYEDFERAGILPLWTQRDDLMPLSPQPAAVPHVWPWREVYPLAQRAGKLVPVGRGGERRAIALANPGLAGQPYATPTLWAAVQYLGPREMAPEHRHTQSAFRFILEGDGVWTVVDGDPVAMRRGDLLLTAGWCWHGHHNTVTEPMAWLDGLDIPFTGYVDAGFFEFGPDQIADRSTPAKSRSERLWGHPGLRPAAAADDTPHSPLAAYRWEHTDAALGAQLELQADGHPGAAGPGHAAVRFTNPTTGRDALPTLRTEMHRLRAGAATAPQRAAGSSVWQVFDGSGTVSLNGGSTDITHGDLIAVPSWCTLQFTARDQLDLFCFSDAPILERLNLARSEAAPATTTRNATAPAGNANAGYPNTGTANGDTASRGPG